MLEAPENVPEAGGERRRFTRADALVIGCYVVAAFVLYAGLWTNLGRGGYMANSFQDQNMWEWFFAVTAHAVFHWENPLFSDLQNYPVGVNLMANTAMFGLGIPLSPVTQLFGPTVTWAIALTGGLAGTATAWYWVFSRHLVGSRTAAAIGGAFCGYAPAMVSHGNAHPNFVVLFLIPFIVLRLIRLAQGRRPVRDGIILGLMLAYQVFLGEEPLLIMMMAFVLFAAGYAVSRPREALRMVKPMAGGLAIAAIIAVAITIYPLWWQFFGSQSYRTIEHGPVGNDTAALTRFATESIAGAPQAAADVSMNRTEENAFFGWPLIILMVVLTVWLWRNVLARAAAISMFLMAWLSLGVQIIVNHRETGIPGPWKLLFEQPLFDSLLESRLAIGCIPAIAALLAIATERVFRAAPNFRDRDLPVRFLWLGALAAVLIPVAPTPLKTELRPDTPAFFTDGAWRQYVGSGSLVTVPLPSDGDARALNWQVQAGLGFPVPGGYFVGPIGPDDRRGRYGAANRPTAELLAQVRSSGDVPDVTGAQRAQAIEDLKYWKADAVVLAPIANGNALHQAVDQLIGASARYVDGVWVWDVRALRG
nr:glycosyl transferase [Amycolatopsis granulosa]